MVKINYNSLHAKLYRFFYATDTMPKNLCPYFWKTVLAFLFIIPIVILSAPVYVVARIREDKVTDGLWIRIGFGALCWFGLFISFSVVASILYIFLASSMTGQFWEVVVALGFSFILIAIVIALVILKEKYQNRLRDLYYANKITREEYESRKKIIPLRTVKVSHPKDWLLVKFITAWYNRNCPLVEWNSK